MKRRTVLAGMLGAGASLLAACTPPLSSPSTGAGQAAPTAVARPPRPVDLWNGAGVDARVLLQREVDRLPEGPHMLRVTELEMSPGASIDPRTHLGPGAQVVLSGAFTNLDPATGAPTVYEATAANPFPVFLTGMVQKYSTENRGTLDNRLFMAELLSRSREFLGNQQFDVDGVVHNRGGVRSGPYVQVALEKLPPPPLMVRVSQIDMGPKAKTPEYTRPGPGVFFVVSGQVTWRRQSALFITTHGAGGYYVDEGEPIILENKPVPPNRLIAVEFLPAALGKQPSTVPTGREL